MLPQSGDAVRQRRPRLPLGRSPLRGLRCLLLALLLVPAIAGAQSDMEFTEEEMEILIEEARQALKKAVFVKSSEAPDPERFPAELCATLVYKDQPEDASLVDWHTRREAAVETASDRPARSIGTKRKQVIDSPGSVIGSSSGWSTTRSWR